MNKTALSQPKRVLLFLIILLLIYFAYSAVKRGIADVFSYTPKAIMSQWGKGSAKVGDENWQKANQSLLAALEYSPENSDYLTLMGNLYEWRGTGKALNSAEVISDYQIALTHYRQAAQQQPAFAFYWANIAVVKSILSEVDEEFYSSIMNALKLGPWEPGVQLKIADATLGSWFLLDDNGRNKAVENVERAMKKNAAAIIKIAKRYQVQHQLCAKLGRTPEMLAHCK